MKPKVSVVIPVYNGAEFIGKTIRSVLAQERPPNEIIVVDDGSTDDTPRVLAGYGDKIRTKRIANSGASNARNVALSLATGDLIAFLDADDLWYKDKLRKQEAMLEKFPEAGLVTCDYELDVPQLGGQRVRHYSGLRHAGEMSFNAPLKTDPFALLIRQHFIGTPSAVLARRGMIERAGLFVSEYQPSEDFDFWLKCARIGSFIVMDEPLFYKRVHDRNLSNDQIKMEKSHHRVLTDTLVREAGYIRSAGLEKLCRRAVAGSHYRLGHLLWAAGRRREAFESYCKGLRSGPDFGNALEFGRIVSRKTAGALIKGRAQ